MSSKPPLPSQSVDALLKALLVLSRTVDHVLQTRAFETAVPEPLSSSAAQVLRLLGKGGRHTLGRVARFLDVSRPAVSQIVDSMERSGLVARRPASHDRRAIFLELTPKGVLRYLAMRKRQRHLIRRAVRQSIDGEAEQWAVMLTEITVGLARADRAFKHYCLQCGAHDDGSCVLVGGGASCLFLEHHESTPKRPRRKTASRASN